MNAEQSFKTYQTIENDTWDLIAFKIFGDGKYTSYLLKANPELNKIVIFPAGVLLKVPDITQNNVGDMPPWITE